MGAYDLNLVQNGDLELWDAGPVPRFMDAQVTNTAITIIDRTDDEQALARRAWADIAGRLDKYEYQGMRSLRATLAAAAAVDAFRLHPEGVNAVAWTGASPQHISVGLHDATPDIVAGQSYFGVYRLSFAARCSVDGNLVRGRLVLRDSANGIQGHLVNDAWAAADAAGRPLWALRTVWRRYGVTFEVPPDIGDATGPSAIENFVWQLSNGTAGAQVIDLDDIEVRSLEIGMAGR